MNQGLVQKVVYAGPTELQLQATVTERLLLQNYLLKYLEQTQSSVERGCASYWVLVIADASILFPVLWLKLFDVTVDLLVELIIQMDVTILYFHVFFLLKQT